MSQKRARETDYLIDYDNNMKMQRVENYVNDPYERSIYIAGKKEVHFNAGVTSESICRIKKLISEIISDHSHLLIRRETNKKDLNKIIDDNDDDDNDEFVITYIVNSGGGSVHAVLDFVDFINYQKSIFSNLKFTSIATGLVASAGTTMCIVADYRKMTKSAFAMIHELSTGVSRSNYTKIRTYSDFLDKLHKRLVDIYLESRGFSIEDDIERTRLEKELLEETWMTAEEYKSAGFVSEII
jgi:ATP-dependent protease ClpP protease subunit